MNPPLAARILLMAAVGDREADLVAGDLHEEFVGMCESHGIRAANRWYAGQVLRSAGHLCRLRVSSGEATHLILACTFGIGLPLLALDRLWTFVYSQVPLKDGLQRATIFLIVNLICLALGGVLAGYSARSARQALIIAIGAVAAASLALLVCTGQAPPLYAGAAVMCACSGSLLRWRILR